MSAPCYLIGSPYLRTGPGRKRWERWHREVAELLPGRELVSWPDLPAGFRDVPCPDRPARLARALSGAVVMPDKLSSGEAARRFIGRVALAEAEAFAAAGKPVHVYAGGRLIAWADCRVSDALEVAPRFAPHAVLIPAQQPRREPRKTGVSR